MVPPSQTASPARLDPLERLATLFSQHGRRLEQIAAPLLRGSGSAPEDVVGDVVLRYAERLSSGAPAPDDEPAYLAQMVRNRCMDLQRSAARWGGPLGTDHATSSSAEDVALDREELAAMVEDLSLLPDRQRRAILDVSVGGLSHRDAALREDATAQASKSLLARALRNLRALRAAREAPCDTIRLQLRASRTHGHRPAEDVRRHLRVCAPCRLDDAGARTAAGRTRLGALVGACGHWLAELLSGPVAAPLSKTVAATVAVVAAVPLATGGDPSPPSAAEPVVAAPAKKAVRAAVPPAPVEREERTEPRKPAATPAPVEPDRVGAWRALVADLDQGNTLNPRSKAALLRWCRSAGEKGLVGTTALSERCPAALLDTPQRRAKVERVRARREKDAARAKEREAAAPAPAPAVAPQPQDPPPSPPPALAAAPAPDPAAEPEQLASVGEPTKDAAGPTPLDMQPQGQEKPPPPDPEMGAAGEPGGGVDDPDHVPPDPYVEGKPKSDADQPKSDADAG